MLNQSILGQSPKAAAFRIFGAVALALALLLNAGTAARAQSVCTTHSAMAEQLKSKYAENRIAVALTSKGSLVEVFSSADGATWTVVVTLIDGRSCILIAGEDWQDARRVAQGPQV
ncbi:MAG: hypothetical protein ACE5GS_03080 [Kiloniellaceae bacterium]